MLYTCIENCDGWWLPVGCSSVVLAAQTRPCVYSMPLQLPVFHHIPSTVCCFSPWVLQLRTSPLTLPAIRLHSPAEEPEGSVWDDPTTLQSLPLAGPQGGQPPRASQRCFSPVWRLPSAGTELHSRGDRPWHAETVWCHDGMIHSSTVPVN